LGHPDGAYGSFFTRDNQRLVTACRDKIIRVWNVNNGRLINTIGSRLDVGPFIASAEIAPLGSIAFDWEKYDIASDLAARIYRDNPQNLTRQGIQYLANGHNAMGNYNDGLQKLAEAERIFLDAKKLDKHLPLSADYDSLIAEVYSERANLFLLHRQFDKALQTAREGMHYKPLDFLKIYEVNCLLLSGQYDAALQKAQAIKTEKVTHSFYPDMPFGQVFGDELIFYREQYGIEHPDIDRFIETLKAPGGK
jgi:tetratricopeptide (TPR) repeat protein